MLNMKNRRGWLFLLTAVLAVWMTVSLCAGEENAAGETEEKDYTLQQVVVLSRHNIRSPLSEKGSMISEITPHEWFAWTSNPGELSLLGAMLETTMGQYFRLWLEDEGLFPENYIPKDGAVRFYANAYQRTQATAHYFSTGLLPVAVVPVERHQEYGEPDDTFLPKINFLNDAYEQDVREEVAQRGGGEGLTGYRESLDDAFKLLMDVTDMEDSEAYVNGEYGDLLEDETVLQLAEGEEPTVSGPIKMACSIADALVLQYYEEPDDLAAAFGHELSEEDWKTIGSVVGTYEKILFSAPSLAVNLAHPMLKEIYAELNAQGRQFSFLCGHDSTITSFLAALGVQEYTLPGAIESTTPIGIKVVFERWQNKEGKSFYKANLVYQSVEQLRSLQPLSLEVPPMIVPISFEGIETNEDGMIAEKDLMGLFEAKIGMLEELEEEYAEDTEAAEEEAAEEEAVTEEAAAEEAVTEETVAAEAAEEALTEEADRFADVVPVTWEPSPEHPIIDTDEARQLYADIRLAADGKADYPTLDELKANPVVAQIDDLSAYYKDFYGNTAEIDTPERKELRAQMLADFLDNGSARTEVDEDGKAHYVYDGELKKEFRMEVVLGLPASGKSTRVTDPDSEEMGAFIMDCDMIKESLPEYKESHGAAADAVHFEGFSIMLEALSAFTEGELKGTNVILPIVSSNAQDLLETYIYPFEEAGYNVRVKFCPASPDESAARVVMRELIGGQVINSGVAFSFGYGPEDTYYEIAGMTNAFGETYGYDVEAETDEAA